VFGLPRSGTTLIEQVLASHPKIHGAGELHLGQKLLQSIPTLTGPRESRLISATGLDSSSIRQLANAYEDHLHILSGGAERVVDKLPENYLYLGLLVAMFPKATFIHCTRDLRDVAVSCWMTDFQSIRWAHDLEHIARRFRQYRRLMEHWHAVLPVVIHEVSYEEVVTDLESEARRLAAVCGMDWDPRCLDYYRTERPVGTASAAQVRQPIYTRSVERWRNYQIELASLFAALPGDEKGTSSAPSGLGVEKAM
jgi:hypothetical protein